MLATFSLQLFEKTFVILVPLLNKCSLREEEAWFRIFFSRFNCSITHQDESLAG